MIVIFVEFIDQLMYYPINRASLNVVGTHQKCLAKAHVTVNSLGLNQTAPSLTKIS